MTVKCFGPNLEYHHCYNKRMCYHSLLLCFNTENPDIHYHREWIEGIVIGAVAQESDLLKVFIIAKLLACNCDCFVIFPVRLFDFKNMYSRTALFLTSKIIPSERGCLSN